jgi:DNA topoisomerase I
MASIIDNQGEELETTILDNIDDISVIHNISELGKIDFKIGQKWRLNKLILTQKFTEPPSRYSAASLIKKLEDLGIGRPSTYASTISTLQDRGYVEVGNSMKPSTLGRKVNQILVDNFIEVTDAKMTADMEENLDLVSVGDYSYNQILDKFWWDFKSNVETKSVTMAEKKQDYRTTKTDIKCPKCENEMELKMGRFGEYYQCLTTHEHQFPKNFKEYEIAYNNAIVEFQSQTEGKKCTECGKDMIIRVSKSSLKPYIACPEYRVGNKHTVTNILKEGETEKPKSKSPAKKSFKKISKTKKTK